MDTKIEKGKFKVLLSKNKPKQRIHQDGTVSYPRATPLSNYKNINDIYIQKLLKSNEIWNANEILYHRTPTSIPVM